jgi:hypothetical protein
MFHMSDDAVLVAVKCCYPSTPRMASREELDQRAQAGETVVPGGTGGKSLEAQEHLAEGTHSTSFFCHLITFYSVDVFGVRNCLF